MALQVRGMKAQFGLECGRLAAAAGALLGVQPAGALAGLVAATGLSGLVSADLMVDGEAWWLLEVNPRPGATLDLLDRGPVPLFHAHLAASRGRLPEARPVLTGAAAAEILYADAPISAVPVLDMPRVRQAWDDVLSGRRRFDSAVWRWLNLVRWSEKFCVSYSP